MDHSLLITKLYIPKPRPDWIDRRQLIRSLEGFLRSGCHLTLICAPAGYGKSTLAANWLAVRSASNPNSLAAWLSIDEGDNDPQRFFTYLLAALRQVLPEFGEATANLLVLPNCPPPANLMVVLINELASALELAAVTSPLLLVFDDYHFIQNPLLQDAFELLISQPPGGFHLALITREDPPFPLARFRGRGEMAEVRAADLRFQPDEVDQFFQRLVSLGLMNHPLPEDALLALGERCDGWAVGLRMAALTLRGGEDIPGFLDAFNGNNRYVTDFLMEEVMSRQSPERIDFLQKTSILDRFTADLCGAVLEKDSSECHSILAELEHSGLFLIPLGDASDDRGGGGSASGGARAGNGTRRAGEPTWFRYHHLFSDLLRSRLDPGDQKHLHRRAAEWFERQGFLPEAIRHALDSSDTPLATRLVRAEAEKAIQRAELSMLLGWLQRLPENVVSGDLDLAMYQALALFLNGKMQPAAELLTWLKANPGLPSRPDLLGRVLVLSTWLDGVLTGQADVSAVREAYDLLDPDDGLFKVLACQPLGGAQIRAGNPRAANTIFIEGLRIGQKLPNPTASLSNLYNCAFTLNLEGRREAAMRLCQEALPHFSDRRSRPLPAAGLILVPLGVLQYEANEIEKSIESLTLGLALCRQISPALVLIEASLVKAYLAQGAVEAAFSVIETARRQAEAMHIPRTLQIIDAIEAQALLQMGQVEAANQRYHASGLTDFEPLQLTRDMEYLTGVRLMVAQGQTQSALSLLERLEQGAEAGGRMRFLMSASLLRCLALFKMDRQQPAAIALERAIRLAAPENYLRLFLDEDPAYRALLPLVRPAAPAFVDALESALQKSGKWMGQSSEATRKNSENQSGMPGSNDLLSDREMEVLRLMSEGFSNQEIADRLVIALSTVKRHNSNIFNKLGVENRTQALIQGQKLGIL